MAMTPLSRLAPWAAAPLLCLLGCQPTRGYQTMPLNSPHQNPPAPTSVQAGGGGTPQPSPPRRGVPGGEQQGDPSAGGGGQAACAADRDCVPDGCCHPAACVPRAAAPACQDVMCTMECRPNTLDCGGRCACESGRCVAHHAGP